VEEMHKRERREEENRVNIRGERGERWMREIEKERTEEEGMKRGCERGVNVVKRSGEKE